MTASDKRVYCQTADGVINMQGTCCFSGKDQTADLVIMCDVFAVSVVKTRLQT